MSDPASSTAESRPEPDLSGRQLGDYRILRRLGRGGMAEVYLAEQTSLRRQVALKVLRSNLAEDASYIRRFQNEAQAAAKLVHANIVQIHEVGCLAGVHFIAQEYVPGQNLKQVLAKRGALEVTAAINVMRQVAAALYKAADQGIIHRDIKPENIMLTPQGEVKVADFGLARVAVDGQQVDLTQVGITMGTPLYMSPEQVEGRKVDPRSDIYSFGVTCYQMLAGRPPFEGESPLAVAVQHLNTEPRRLEDQRKDLPEGLCRIVHRMLAKDSAKRYQNASELLRELRALNIEGVDPLTSSDVDQWNTSELLALSGGRAEATQHLNTVMQSQARWSARNYAWVLIIGLVVIAFLGGSLFAWMSRPDPLLSDTSEARVEKKKTANDQLWYAFELNSEDGWLSIEKYFPAGENRTNAYYVMSAQQRLAEYYRERDELASARRVYEGLARQEAEPQFAAVGYFGQANLSNAAGKSSDALSQLAKGYNFWIELRPSLQSRTRAVLDDDLNRELDAMLIDREMESGEELGSGT